MTRSQLIIKMAEETGLFQKQVEQVLDCFADTIIECLSKGEKVTIPGFGRFEMRSRKPKNYTNPKTRATKTLEATSIPGFKSSAIMKNRTER